MYKYKLSEKEKWTRPLLSRMLIHKFIGTLADNIIEIGWILCFSLLADKHLVERITALFGLNDAFWVIMSATYYTSRTAMVAIMPKKIAETSPEVESKHLKTAIYLTYIMLLPFAIASYVYMPRLLEILGVRAEDMGLYLPYMKITVLSIMFCAPWATIIPSYYSARGKTKVSMIQNHMIAWTMMIGIFITTHIFHKGVLWAMVINMFANAIPLYWFLIDRPIKGFWKKGFEFDIKEIGNYWRLVKWELIRRLAPRLSALFGVSLMITYNPIILGIKYWISNLAMLPEGWVDAEAGLLNTHVSRNAGLKIEKPYEDNNYLFKKSLIGVIITVIVIYLVAVFGLKFLPESIYNGVINPWIYIFLIVEVGTKLRYYTWLSISRGYRHELNGVAQLCYAVPTAILAPILLYLSINVLRLEMTGIAATGAIVGSVQCILAEIWFKYKIKDYKK